MRHTAKIVRTLCALAIAVAAALSTFAPSLYAKDFGKIMPLGDSITKGTTKVGTLTTTVPGGYRDPLYDKLTGAGHTFQFVGSTNINPTETLTTAKQDYHEGWGGYLIDGAISIGSDGKQDYGGLAENLKNWLDASTPDTILLMIGTNDIGKGYATGATNRLETLIRSIYTYSTEKDKNHHVAVYVASLAPRPQSTSINNAVKSFNLEVPGIVDDCVADGLDVHYVDMYTPLNANTALYLSDDKLHPSAAGYQVIADTWYNALAVPEPSCVVLLIVGAAMFGIWRLRNAFEKTSVTNE